jgi:hypothetical protein
MKPMIAQTLRSRWLAGLVHLALWLLLYLAVAGLGGNAPAYRETDGSQPPPRSPEAIAKLDRLFSSLPVRSRDTNAPNAFFTRHFLPTPTPAPPPPTTRKIELVYQGFFSTDTGGPQTMIKMGEKYVITPVGSNVTANLFVAQASVLSLTLTNTSGQTNLLALNVKKEVEVPIK